MPIVHCTHCGDEASQHCAGCKVVKYCSKECQTADWKWHKLLCKQSASFVERPDDGDKTYRRIILLPADSEKPVFYWMPVKVKKGADQDENKEEELDVEIVPDLETIFGNEIHDFIPLVIGKFGHGELLDHSIHLRCKDDFMDDAPNLCIARLLGSDVSRRFRGPLVFLRMTKVADSALCLDSDASDFTLALDGMIDWFKKGQNPTDFFLKGRSQHPKNVQGVRLNVDIPFYEDFKVLRNHKIFGSAGKPSGLSAKLGIPLVTAPASDEDENSAEPLSDEHVLSLIQYLHVSIDPMSSNFGNVQGESKNKTSSTLVFRADKMPLSTSTVVAICDFIKDEAQPVLLYASKLPVEKRETAVDTVVKMYQERNDDSGSDTESEDIGDEDEGEAYDAGAYDDLADVRAKMGQMQMASIDARTGAGYI